MKESVKYIVKNLVDNPDQVRITEVGGTHTLIIELAVDKGDIGKIIGKREKRLMRSGLSSCLWPAAMESVSLLKSLKSLGTPPDKSQRLPYKAR